MALQLAHSLPSNMAGSSISTQKKPMDLLFIYYHIVVCAFEFRATAAVTVKGSGKKTKRQQKKSTEKAKREKEL